MSDNFRYRYGDTDPVLLPFKSAVAVSIGDLVYEDDGDSYTAKPASSITWTSALAAPSGGTLPTAADGAVAIGTLFTNAAWHLKFSFNTAYGEGALSASVAVTPTLGAGVKIGGIVLPAGVTSMNVYCEEAAGSGNFFKVAQTYGQDFLLTSTGTTGTIVPGTALTALQMTQQLFVSKFVGVSAQRYDGTNSTAYGIKDGKLRIDTRGVYDFACASATFNPGDLVGPDKDTGNALLSQQVVAVANRAFAVGKVLVGGASVTSVRVEIFGTKTHVGVNPQPLP